MFMLPISSIPYNKKIDSTKLQYQQVLPLAVAYSRLLSKACDISTRHASNVAKRAAWIEGKTETSNFTTTTKNVNDNNNDDNINNTLQQSLNFGHASVKIDIGAYLPSSTENLDTVGGGGGYWGMVNVNLYHRRPDCIFEVHLASGIVPGYTGGIQPTPSSNIDGKRVHLSKHFLPRAVPSDDTRRLGGTTTDTGIGSMPVSPLLGTIRIALRDEGNGGAGADNFTPIGPTAMVGTRPKDMVALVPLEPFLNCGTATSSEEVSFRVVDAITGVDAGVILVTIKVSFVSESFSEKKSFSEPVSPSPLPLKSSPSTLNENNGIVSGGLVSLVGLDTLLVDDVETAADSLCCFPPLDEEKSTSLSLSPQMSGIEVDPATERRRRQLLTMGEFLTHNFLFGETNRRANIDSAAFAKRAEAYSRSLLDDNKGDRETDNTHRNISSGAIGAKLMTNPPDKRRDPYGFRPSSSKDDTLLTGIGFNVHVQNLSVLAVETEIVVASTATKKIEASRTTTTTVEGTANVVPCALLQNITHGAPADHARGVSLN